MDENMNKLLKNICPQCKSTNGDITPYFPQVIGNEFEQELICDNCGCRGVLRGKIIETEFEPSI